jgi:hypothetical protein
VKYLKSSFFELNFPYLFNFSRKLHISFNLHTFTLDIIISLLWFFSSIIQDKLSGFIFINEETRQKLYDFDKKSWDKESRKDLKKAKENIDNNVPPQDNKELGHLQSRFEDEMEDCDTVEDFLKNVERKLNKDNPEENASKSDGDTQDPKGGGSTGSGGGSTGSGGDSTGSGGDSTGASGDSGGSNESGPANESSNTDTNNSLIGKMVIVIGSIFSGVCEVLDKLL